MPPPPPPVPPPPAGGLPPTVPATGGSRGCASESAGIPLGDAEPVIRSTGRVSSCEGPMTIESVGSGIGGEIAPAGRLRTSSRTRSCGRALSAVDNAGLVCIRLLPRDPGDRPAIRAAGSRKVSPSKVIPLWPKAAKPPISKVPAMATTSSGTSISFLCILPICTLCTPVVWTSSNSRINVPAILIIKRLAYAIDPA